MYAPWKADTFACPCVVGPLTIRAWCPCHLKRMHCSASHPIQTLLPAEAGSGRPFLPRCVDCCLSRLPRISPMKRCCTTRCSIFTPAPPPISCSSPHSGKVRQLGARRVGCFPGSCSRSWHVVCAVLSPTWQPTVLYIEMCVSATWISPVMARLFSAALGVQWCSRRKVTQPSSWPCIRECLPRVTRLVSSPPPCLLELRCLDTCSHVRVCVLCVCVCVFVCVCVLCMVACADRTGTHGAGGVLYCVEGSVRPWHNSGAR